MSLKLAIPKRLEKRLKEESEKASVSIEEIALEALYKGLGEELDPSERAEAYKGLSEKYFAEADAFSGKRDYAQASEKLWGSVALMVKAVAAKRNIIISSHGDLYSFVTRLGTEQKEPELRRLFAVAGTLHQNFYENWLPEEVVKEYAEDVNQLLNKLRKLL